MRQVTFQEHYTQLGDMKPGDIAVSKNRERFFVCGYHYDKIRLSFEKVIFDMNDLSNQYTESMDMEQPVKILKAGDKFICLA